MRQFIFLLCLLALGLPISYAHAAEAPQSSPQSPSPQSSGFTDSQRAEIENIIKDYLTTKHPEVMAQGLEILQKRTQDDADAKSKTEITASKDKLYNDPTSPVGGNPKGNVTIVEFYDYQCGYCKMSEEAVERLLKDDKNVKFVYKDFPILGPASLEAAKASLASAKQRKFQAFHDALLTKKEHLTSDLIYQTAKDVGLDVDKLKKDMADASINDAVNANIKLGSSIGARGTPTFLINETVYPGALQYDQLKQAVSDARNSGKKS